MVKLFVFTLLALVLALLISLFFDLPSDPGYLLIAFGNYSFETSLVALIGLLLVFYILYKALVLLLRTINPKWVVRLGKKIQRQRRAKARSKTLEGLLFFARRNWRSSHQYLSKGMADDDATVVNYLAAAWSAHELGEKEQWQQCLDDAEAQFPLARSTINFVRAQLLFKSNQLEQCLAILEQMRKNSVNDNSLLDLLKEVYIKLDDWQKLADLLPTLQKNKLVDEAEVERIEVRLFMERLYGAASPQPAIAEEAKKTNTDALHSVWKAAAPKFKSDPKVVKHYAQLLIDADAMGAAAKVIESSLNRNWDDDLIALYGAGNFTHGSKELLVAETWLKARPANSTLLLALGRICLRNELWGKARSYFEASVKIAPALEVYGELSRLLANLGEKEAADAYFEKYQQLSKASLPELPQPTLEKSATPE